MQTTARATTSRLASDLFQNWWKRRARQRERLKAERQGRLTLSYCNNGPTTWFAIASSGESRTCVFWNPNDPRGLWTSTGIVLPTWRAQHLHQGISSIISNSSISFFLRSELLPSLALLMISAWICKLFYSFSSRFTSEERQDFHRLVLALYLYAMFSLCSLGPAGFIIRARIQAAPSTLAKNFFRTKRKHPHSFPVQPSLLPQLCRLKMPATEESDHPPLPSTEKPARSPWAATRRPRSSSRPQASELFAAVALTNLFVDAQGLQQPVSPQS